MTLIAPSLLSADFSKLGKEIKDVEKAGADLVHWDVMDGHFVPNLTFGPPVIKANRSQTKLPFDVHLMVDRPDKLIDSIAEAGADMITVHMESNTRVADCISHIHALGKKAGISLKPHTSVAEIIPFIPEIDLANTVRRARRGAVPLRAAPSSSTARRRGTPAASPSCHGNTPCQSRRENRSRSP